MYLFDIVKLFPENDKSELKIIYKKNIVFSGRVDYLQFNQDGMLNPICNKLVSMWYIEYRPINPKNAMRTTDNKYIIVPNIMTIIVTDPPEESGTIRFFNDIPHYDITLRDLISSSALLITTNVELVGEDDEDPMDIIAVSDMFSYMINKRTRHNPLVPTKSEQLQHLPDDVYDRAIVSLDLSCQYIDPEKETLDDRGFYSGTRPRLSITLERSLYGTKIETKDTGVNFYDHI